MNFVILVGRAGNEVKTIQTSNGKTLATFSVATNRRKKDGTFDTTWHRVVAWEGLARHCVDIKKGDKVFVKGEIQVREYEKDGKKAQSFEVVAQEVLRTAPSSAEPVTIGEEGPSPW